MIKNKIDKRSYSRTSQFFKKKHLLCSGATLFPFPMFSKTLFQSIKTL